MNGRDYIHNSSKFKVAEKFLRIKITPGIESLDDSLSSDSMNYSHFCRVTRQNYIESVESIEYLANGIFTICIILIL